MRIDKSLQFSDKQAITATADSEREVDFTALGNFSTGDNFPVEVIATGDFSNNTGNATLTIEAFLSDKEDFSGNGTKTIQLAVAKVGVKAGEVVYAGSLPKAGFQFMKLKYTASANFKSPTAVSAYIPTTLV